MKKPALRNCSISTCDTKRALDKGFYQIPEHDIKRKKWFKVCGIPLTKKVTIICWKHFKSDQFRGKIDASKRIFGHLIKNAFPTENLPSTPLIVNLNRDFELGRRVEIKLPVQKPQPESSSLKLPNNEHDYSRKSLNPLDMIKKLKRQVKFLNQSSIEST